MLRSLEANRFRQASKFAIYLGRSSLGFMPKKYTLGRVLRSKKSLPGFSPPMKTKLQSGRALAAAWTAPEAAAQEDSLFFPAALRFLGTLEVLEADWHDLLMQAEQAAEVREEEALLERIAVYFAFRYLLKAVNDGDLLGRAQLVVFSVLVVERLGAVCGIGEALRRYSSEIEHNDDNLAALLEAFWQQEALSLEQFLSALE